MKTIILIILLAISFISCNTDDMNAQVNNNTEYKQVISDNLIGEYKHHLGEEVEGDITITSERIIINTSEVNYDIDITSSEVVVKLWCNDKNLDITFIQCKKKVMIRIVNYIGQSDYSNYITLSKDYNVIGNFDPIILN